MKKVAIIFLLYLFSANLVNAQLSKFHWAKNMGGTLMDEGNSLALDSNGNIYITGWFQGNAQFGIGIKTINLYARGESDIFVAKLDSYGDLLWVKQMGGPLNEGGYSICIDSHSNVYVGGIFNGTVDFDPSVKEYNLNSVGHYDIFIAKIDPLGNFIWAKQFGGTSIDHLTSLVTDRTGNIYAAGYFSGTSDFDPGNHFFNLSSEGTDSTFDSFIAKLDPSGNFLWAKRIGGDSQDLLHSLTLDYLGNLYAIGSFIGTSDFNPGTDTFILSSQTNRDIYVEKLDSSGDFVWAKQMGGTGRDIGYSIAVDLIGNVYTTGSFEGSADFDPSPNVFNLTGYGQEDIFICKLDAQGNFIWANRMGGASSDAGLSLTIDSAANIYIIGWFSDTADFAPGVETYNLTSKGREDVFITKLDSSGSFKWAERMGGREDDMGFDIVVDVAGSIYSIGYFVSDGDFSLDEKIAYNLTSSGSHDIFIKKYSPFIVIPQGNIFYVYPNPCSKLINLALTKTFSHSMLRISNLLGQLVIKNDDFNGNSCTIEISHLASGLYFIEVDDWEITHRSLFIKE